MTTLIGLFANQQNAEKAIEALSIEELEDIEIETIDSWSEDHTTAIESAPALNSGYGTGGIPVAVALSLSWNMADEEEQFFKRAVENGGVLIVVDVADEEQVEQVRRVLEENSEKVTISS